VARAGLNPALVAVAAAELADEVGLENVTMTLVAERLDVRTPSLYKHVGGQADLTRRVAVLALTDLGDELRETLQGRSGHDALTAAARTFRAYVIDHPGRYAATVRLDPEGPHDPLEVAGARVLTSLSAVLGGYGIRDHATVHALRTMRSLFHGFAVLEAAGGFQMDADVDDSFAWLVTFLHRGLLAREPSPAEEG